MGLLKMGLLKMGLLKKVCTALLHDSKIAVCGVSAEVKLSKISFFQWSQVSTLHNAPCGLSAAVEGVEFLDVAVGDVFDAFDRYAETMRCIMRC